MSDKQIRDTEMLEDILAAVTRDPVDVDLHTLKVFQKELQRVTGKLSRKGLATIVEQLISAAPCMVNASSSALAYLIVGQVLTQLGDYSRALRNLRKAHSLYESLDFRPNVAIVDMSIAGVLSALGRNRDALGVYDQAVDLLQAVGIEIEVNLAAALANKADVLRTMGNLAQAVRLLDVARNTFKKTGKEIEVAIAGWRAAQINLALGRLSEAMKLAGQAERILEEHGMSRYLAHVKLTKAAIHRHSGEYDEAESIYRRVRAQFKEDHHELGVSRVDGERASVYVDQGQYERAVTTYSAIRAVFQEHRAVSNWAQATLQLATAMLFLNQYEQALYLLDQAEDAYSQMGLEVERARIWTNKAIILDFCMDRSQEALTLFQQARAFFQTRGFGLDLANTCLSEGNCLVDLGHCHQALELYWQAEAFFKRNEMKRNLTLIDLNKASAYLEMGLYDRAESVYDQLLKEKREPVPAEAILLRCYAGKALIYGKRGQWPDALANYGKAIEVFERQRASFTLDEFRFSILRDKLELYKQSVLICIRLGDTAGGLEYFERYKSRVLLEQLAQRTERNRDTRESVALRQGVPLAFREVKSCLQSA